MDNEPFKIELKALKTSRKYSSQSEIEAAEKAGEKLGFIDRDPKRKRGRKPSPRTGQVHAKVMPQVSIEIANEARRRGVQQGVLIEDAWLLYKKENDI